MGRGGERPFTVEVSQGATPATGRYSPAVSV